MPKLVAHIVNCWLKGNEWSDVPKGKIRNRISFSAGGFEMALLRTPETFADNIGDMKGQQVYTSDLVFEDVEQVDLARAKRVALSIAELLSFGLLSQVAVFGFSYNGTQQQFVVRGKLFYFRPVFGPALGPEMKVFLETTYPTFRRLRARRSLHVIFDYLTTAEIPDQSTAWIYEQALRQRPEVASDATWQGNLGMMIEKAKPHGWVDEAKKAIKAHIEWTEK